MLPYFVEQDFHEVLAHLRERAMTSTSDGFAAHLEFRFPKIGSIAAQGVELELRQALEPWHVLGEEAGGGGTVRTVDSSLERMQVKVTGLTGIALCGGVQWAQGAAASDGRCRARRWRACVIARGSRRRCLHPTIPVHTPLVFDIVDQWNERSVGGACIM